MTSPRDGLKDLLAGIPGAAQLYWRAVDGGGPTLHFSGHNSLERLESELPAWVQVAEEARRSAPSGRRLLLFATFRYWIEHAVLTGLALHGLGHDVTLVYLPYAKYKIASNRFDLLRQEAYLRRVLAKAEPALRVEALYSDEVPSTPLPEALKDPIREISRRDAQYSLRIEDVDEGGELFRLREARNRYAARAALRWLAQDQPDVVIIPNGSILEYGVFYHAARHAGLPVVTYEFDEPQHRIRLAHNEEVMREDTGAFWQARKDMPFTPDQREKLRALLAARQRGSLWENFPIQFQGTPRSGERRVRRELGLDERPIALIAPNVFGDSATLGRQVFSRSMTEWLTRTLLYFRDRQDVQAIVRIHPSETRFPYGTSMETVVEQTLPELPAHMRLVSADASINTYDLIDIADLGVVYTTTVGLEMAMSAVPVVVAGFTHYRGKGFTYDPESWEAYFEAIEGVLAAPGERRLAREQVDQVWHYAYRFFFEFTRPFPWHLLYFWDDVEEWPLGRVLGAEGHAIFDETFRLLAGEPLDWSELR